MWLIISPCADHKGGKKLSEGRQLPVEHVALLNNDWTRFHAAWAVFTALRTCCVLLVVQYFLIHRIFGMYKVPD